MRSYERGGYRSGAEVNLELAASSLATVLDYADRFGRPGEVALVSVDAGDLAVERDLRRGARSVALRERQERLALALDDRYDLDGVLVADRVPLTVRLADPVARREVRAYLASLPASQVGAYRVTSPDAP